MTSETVKGFRDFLGEEALKREKIRKILIDKFRTYGFMPAETPIIEYEEFVKQDNSQDETISDVFKLKDKGERNLALRYEFTFQLKRIAQNQKLPYRRYQIGEVFRDEPVSSNRFRQFTQCDVDVISSTIKDEAEVLKLFSEILKELGIEATIFFNNRKLLNEILDDNNLKNNKDNILKEIDKLDKLGEQQVKKNLEKYKAEKIIDLLKKPADYFSKFKSYADIEKLEEYCKIFKIEAKFLPTLARGLSYYNGTVFEIKLAKQKESIAGGGSYLVNGIQSTGISFGLERLSLFAKIPIENLKCLIISIAQEKESIELAEKLRKNKVSCFVMEKISKALEFANSNAVPFVIFVGKEELKAKKLKLRDMKTGKEEMLNADEIIEKLKD